MPWKKMLAYVTGEIDESLLLRIAYLIEENRVLRNQIERRVRLTNPERRVLAEKAVGSIAYESGRLSTRLANTIAHEAQKGAEAVRKAAKEQLDKSLNE